MSVIKPGLALIPPETQTGSGKSFPTNVTPPQNVRNFVINPSKFDFGQQGDSVATSETRSGAVTYGDLATAGPDVSVEVGLKGTVLLIFSAQIRTSGAAGAFCSWSASGANTQAGSDSEALRSELTTFTTQTFARLVSGLQPGTTVFKLTYRTSNSGVGAVFANRYINVIPL